jgi:MFS transporter, DHA1 family, multidrug resistance protein
VSGGWGTRTVPVAIFFSSFAWSFVFVGLPFHIQDVSTVDEAATLRWAGWIMGITSLVSVVAAPVWGRLAERGSPKRCFVLVESLQAVGFFGVALARSLLELFAARLGLGVMGSSSTFAFMLAARTPDPVVMRQQIALIQGALTVGGVVAPLAGAIAAARLGVRASFVLGGVFLLAAAATVNWTVEVPPRVDGSPVGRRDLRRGDVLVAAAIVLAGSVQVYFLAPVLPQVLPALGIAPAEMLEVGGLIIFVSAAAAALGAFAAPYLTRLTSERRLLVGLLTASSLLVTALGGLHSLWSFAVVLFLQALCVAPVFPMVVARVAQHAGGDVIGIVNSARIASAFVGPVLATSVLAWATPGVVYVLMGAVGFACLPLVALPSPADRGTGARRGLRFWTPRR